MDPGSGREADGRSKARGSWWGVGVGSHRAAGGLTRRELLRQLGRQVHSSMARAIQPIHTPDDGDILFTASTGEVAAEDIDSTALGVIASELAWDAVLSCYDQ